MPQALCKAYPIGFQSTHQVSHAFAIHPFRKITLLPFPTKKSVIFFLPLYSITQKGLDGFYSVSKKNSPLGKGQARKKFNLKSECFQKLLAYEKKGYNGNWFTAMIVTPQTEPAAIYNIIKRLSTFNRTLN